MYCQYYIGVWRGLVAWKDRSSDSEVIKAPEEDCGGKEILTKISKTEFSIFAKESHLFPCTLPVFNAQPPGPGLLFSFQI